MLFDASVFDAREDVRIVIAIAANEARSTCRMSSRMTRDTHRRRPLRPMRRMPADFRIGPRRPRKAPKRKIFFPAFTRHWGARRGLCDVSHRNRSRVLSNRSHALHDCAKEFWRSPQSRATARFPGFSM